MTLKTTKKGPKFDSNKSVNEPTDKTGESWFEVEIPKGVRDLIASERKLAQNDIETYVRNRQADLDRTLGYILRGAMGTMEDLPKGVSLTPSEDFTKLVQK